MIMFVVTVLVVDDTVPCFTSVLWWNFLLSPPLLAPRDSGTWRWRQRVRGGLCVTWFDQRHPIGCDRREGVLGVFACAHQHDWDVIVGLHGLLGQVTVRQGRGGVSLHGLWLAGAESGGGDVGQRGNLWLSVVGERTEPTGDGLLVLFSPVCFSSCRDASCQLVCLILSDDFAARLLYLVVVVFLVLLFI